MKEHCPNAHLIKLGTMGEYGTPNIDIEEGWIEITHNGRKDNFLYPRAGGSLYHTTKVLDTDLIWFYVRTFGLKVTDLMQGPVYGIDTLSNDKNDKLLPNFHYDDIFGTVINRFIVQIVANVPLTVYGQGGQTRGYLNILDTLQCVELAAKEKVDSGKLIIMNQFTETFSVNELAQKISTVATEMGIKNSINNIKNPRKELEGHYYNPKSSKLLDLGLKPNYLTKDTISNMIEFVQRHSSKIDLSKINPRVKWNK
jgi:UDP-sulfoquinovose synthase